MSQSSWAMPIMPGAEGRDPAPPLYQRLYALQAPPFELTPDPRFLYLTAQHREALSNLQYGLSTAKPITVLTGEAGTGKTTLLGAALDSDRCRGIQYVCLRNPALTRAEFLEVLARQFGLSEEARASKAAFLTELEPLLKERRARQQITALVVDEAQTVSDEVLEEIRLLANIENATERFLPLVLVGQPELASRLNQPGLRQLKQRVALRCRIAPFGVWETAAYITFRIRTAGGEASRMFTREAVIMIHERSQGIPRTVNVICENALMTGLALDRPRIDAAIIQEVCRDFDLRSDRPATADESVQPERPADPDARTGQDVEPTDRPVSSHEGRPRGILGLVETPSPRQG